MGATGESVRRLSDRGHDPSWSPDGKRIVVSTEQVVDPLSRQSTASELWIIDVGTGEMRRLYSGDAVQPAWSPDGSRVAYRRSSATEPPEVVVQGAVPGASVLRLTESRPDPVITAGFVEPVQFNIRAGQQYVPIYNLRGPLDHSVKADKRPIILPQHQLGNAHV